MPNPTLAIGTTVAQHYRILRPLGVGGYSSVYEAAREGASAPIALKILHTRLGASDTKLRRFEREVELLQRLQHPNVVRMIDYGQTADGLPYIGFELLRGRSLREDLDQRGAMAPAAAGAITRQILLALQAAHGMGIVHRDIKPANIFLCNLDSEAPAVKLLDLGIAKVLHDELGEGSKLTATGDMLGSPHYMAPEQAHGRKVDERVDLYSLGLVLAEMLSGRRVVEGESNVEIAMVHVAPQPHELPEEVSGSALAPVIARAIAKPPDQRYGTAAAMLAELDAAARAVAPAARAPQHTDVLPVGGAPASTAAAAPPPPTDVLPMSVPPMRLAAAASPPATAAALPPASTALPPKSVAMQPASVAMPPSLPAPPTAMPAAAPTVAPLSTAWPQPVSAPTAAASSTRKSGAGRRVFMLLMAVFVLGGGGLGAWWAAGHYGLLSAANAKTVAADEDELDRAAKNRPTRGKAQTVQAQAGVVDQLAVADLEAHIMAVGWSTKGHPRTDRNRGATVTVVRAEDAGASGTFELHRYGSAAGAAMATPAHPIAGRPYAVARGHRQVLIVALSRGDAPKLLRRLLRRLTPRRSGSPAAPGDPLARQDPAPAPTPTDTTRPPAPVATRQPPTSRPAPGGRPAPVGPSDTKSRKPKASPLGATPRTR